MEALQREQQSGKYKKINGDDNSDQSDWDKDNRDFFDREDDLISDGEYVHGNRARLTTEDRSKARIFELDQ